MLCYKNCNNYNTISVLQNSTEIRLKFQQKYVQIRHDFSKVLRANTVSVVCRKNLSDNVNAARNRDEGTRRQRKRVDVCS